MSDRPTPETDALISVGLENADRECVPADFARKLERERDEAIRQRDETNESSVFSCNFYYEEKLKAERERDEARGALASREVVIAQQNVITDLILECNTAREALMKIEQIFIDSDDTYEDLIKMGNIARAVLEAAK
jgi:hypothetical protein